MLSGFSFESCRPASSSSLMGWICSYTPEELILAAGYIPFRVEAAGAGLGSEAYLPANLCPYVRSLLETGLNPGVVDLQGMIFVDSCDAMRRLADVWADYSRIPVLYRLDCPRRQDAMAENYLTERYRELRTVLERHIGRSISEDDIRQSIEITNETRRLMARIAALRRLPHPSISGADFARIVRSSLQSDRNRFNKEAARFLASHAQGENRPSLPRIILSGCALSGSDMPALIEECGVRIIGDDVCTGERHFDGPVDVTPDPLRGLARRYLHRQACARMTGASARINRLIDRAAEYDADGIIVMTLKFCDLAQSDLPGLRQAAQNKGIPLLHIERDSLDGAAGQLRTRIEAFAEVLEQKR